MPGDGANNPVSTVPRTLSYWSRIFTEIPITQKTLREWIDKLNFLEQRPEKLVVNQPVRFTLAKGRSLTIILTREKVIKITIEIVPIQSKILA